MAIDSTDSLLDPRVGFQFIRTVGAFVYHRTIIIDRTDHGILSFFFFSSAIVEGMKTTESQSWWKYLGNY